MSRRELLTAHTASEMAELRAMDARGEIGERRQDLRMAKMTMHIVACLRSRGSGPVRLQDVLLAAVDDPEPAALDAEAQVRDFDRAAGAKWTR